MKKLTIVLVIGVSVLLFGSAVQAHSPGHGGVHGSINLGIPIGHNGYATIGVGSPYYPYYGHSGYGYRYSHGHGWKHGYKHRYRRDHHYYKHGYRHGKSHGRGHSHGHDRYDDRGYGRGHDGGNGRRRH